MGSGMGEKMEEPMGGGEAPRETSEEDES
jgi:hypothetical protein